jgi:hypothetical protein
VVAGGRRGKDDKMEENPGKNANPCSINAVAKKF